MSKVGQKVGQISIPDGADQNSIENLTPFLQCDVTGF